MMRFARTLPSPFQVAALVAISSSAFAADYPLKSAAVADVTIDGGFWGPRVTTNATVTLPHNFDFLEKTSRLKLFDQAAGVDSTPRGEDDQAGDSDVFKIVEGAAYTLQLRPKQIDAAYLARQVGRVIAAQHDDGFLCPRLDRKDAKSRWDEMRSSHVLYSAGHLFEAGVAWHDATGNSDLLDASARCAKLIDEHYGPDKVHDVPGHQEIELALAKLYRSTGDRRYLDLSKFFLDQRGQIHFWNHASPGMKPRAADYNQDRVPLIDASRAVGHAVRAGYTYAAMADIAALYDDHAYRDALDRLWEDVIGHKMYITGGSATAQYYDEGFGDPYHLPNETAYCETCGTIANVLWSHRMALLHADAKYVDVLERALYNGVISGISLSGDKFFYTNALASRGDVRRHESWDPACCQSNLVRIIPQVGSMAYATTADTVYLNLFVAGQASLKMQENAVELRQETEYPLDGRVRVTVEKASDEPFTIALRIPGWAREMPVPSDLYRFAEPSDALPTVSVAGNPIAPLTTEKGYLRITRQWAVGDVIELNLPMPVRRVLANDRVAADQGRVALQRGPLVYCVEAVDNGNLRTDAIVLPDETTLQVERRKDFLGDVVVITGDAAIVSEARWGEAPQVRPHSLLAIPYYAWANRNAGYMDLWLARTPDRATPLPAATAAAEATLSASDNAPAARLELLRDGRFGPMSETRATPTFTWSGKSDDKAWIQCEWPQPRGLSHTAVYWAVDRRQQAYWGPRIRGTDLVLPRSWRVLYQDGDEWKPVETEDPFTLRLDDPNDVRFKPITTRALRVEVAVASAPCGVQEWWVN